MKNTSSVGIAHESITSRVGTAHQNISNHRNDAVGYAHPTHGLGNKTQGQKQLGEMLG